MDFLTVVEIESRFRDVDVLHRDMKWAYSNIAPTGELEYKDTSSGSIRFCSDKKKVGLRRYIVNSTWDGLFNAGGILLLNKVMNPNDNKSLMVPIDLLHLTT